MAGLDISLEQVRRIWEGLTGAQKAVFVSVILGLAAAFASIAFFAGEPEYSVLFSGLQEADAAQVVEKLKADGVPYEITGGGSTILAPVDRVYDLRLTLAAEGIPQGGVIGYEIFDRSTFGETDFAQKIKYSRALEGELTRTIRRLDGVEGARVHLALPERRLFESDAKPATASVVLQLSSSKKLGAKQIQGIVYLVASSVEDLEPGQVTVVDALGNVLFKTSDEEPGMLAASQLEYKRNYEKDAESRVKSMLERVLGQGAAVIQVAAFFDFDKVEETSETYNPDGAVVRSEERVSEAAAGPGGPSGVPGIASNIGAGNAGNAPGQGGSSNRETETVNYEISKTITQISRNQGALKRLSVAVAVDGTYDVNEETGEKTFVPRSEEDRAKIRSLVEKAVGIDPARGDALEVTSIPFQPIEEIDFSESFWTRELVMKLAKYGVLLLMVLIMLFAVIRPILRWLSTAVVGPQISEPLTVAEMERRLADGAGDARDGVNIDDTAPTETVKRENLKKKLLEMVQTEPDIAAQLIRSWISED